MRVALPRNPSDQTLGNLEKPKPLFMLCFDLPKPSYTLSAILGTHMGSPNPSRCLFFEPSQTLFISLLRTMKQPTPFSWFVHGQPKPLPMLYFEPSQTLPTPPWRTIESSVRAICTSEKPHAIAGYTHTEDIERERETYITHTAHEYIYDPHCPPLSFPSGQKELLALVVWIDSHGISAIENGLRCQRCHDDISSNQNPLPLKF